VSVTVLRDAFNDAIKDRGYRCTAVRMRYIDGDTAPRSHQLLEFDIVNRNDNTARTIVTSPIPNGLSLMAAATALAKTLV
jgi:hypothetical protein